MPRSNPVRNSGIVQRGTPALGPKNSTLGGVGNNLNPVAAAPRNSSGNASSGRTLVTQAPRIDPAKLKDIRSRIGDLTQLHTPSTDPTTGKRLPSPPPGEDGKHMGIGKGERPAKPAHPPRNGGDSGVKKPGDNPKPGDPGSGTGHDGSGSKDPGVDPGAIRPPIKKKPGDGTKPGDPGSGTGHDGSGSKDPGADPGAIIRPPIKKKPGDDPKPGDPGSGTGHGGSGSADPGAGAGSSGSGPDLGSLIDSAVGALTGAGGGSGGGDAGGASPADGGSAEPAPAAVGSAAASVNPVALERAEPAAEKRVDIELVDVRLVDTGSIERNMGPRFRLIYRNTGNTEVPSFHVTVAVDSTAELTEKAETVTVEAVGLKPGKSQSVDVRLPVDVLKMDTDTNGKPVPFATLVAMIDSDDSLDEADEDNNVLIFAREEIKSVSQAVAKN
jgi:hypothetical protein